MRKASIVPFLVLYFILVFVTPAYGGDIVFSSPVYLNGSSLYTYNGNASLCNLATDAARAYGAADISILSGNTIVGSLPEGNISGAELDAVIAPDTGNLVTTQLTSGELVSLLNQHLVQGSEYFPQLSGCHVLANRKLTEDGDFCGDVEHLYLGSNVHDKTVDLLTSDRTLTVVTTESLYETYQLSRPKEDLYVSLYDAMATYLEGLSPVEIEQTAYEERVQIVGDTLNLPLILQKLVLRIPSPIVCCLNTPDIIPDSVMFALSGQDRSLSCQFPLHEIPYSLSISGDVIKMPANVDTDIDVSQEVPRGHKTSNMFDSDTVFVDLGDNSTIPEGAVVTADLSAIYPRNTLLFLYYYNANGDILPMPQISQVAENGIVSFQVSPSTTYIINSKQLNRSIGPLITPDHPYVPGIIVCVLAFIAWLIFTLLAQRSKRKKAHSGK